MADESINFDSKELCHSSLCETKPKRDNDFGLQNVTFKQNHSDSASFLLSFETTEQDGPTSLQSNYRELERPQQYIENFPVLTETSSQASNKEAVFTSNHIKKFYTLIKNGNHSQSKKFLQILYEYRETSQFDSIMEILVRLCDYSEVFKKFCVENKDVNDT